MDKKLLDKKELIEKRMIEIADNISSAIEVMKATQKTISSLKEEDLKVTGQYTVICELLGIEDHTQEFSKVYRGYLDAKVNQEPAKEEKPEVKK